jgi:hypothetical protein
MYYDTTAAEPNYYSAAAIVIIDVSVSHLSSFGYSDEMIMKISLQQRHIEV